VKLISMLAILEEFGPATSSDFRSSANIKRGVPTSARVYSVYKNGHCTKKKGPNGFIYAINAAGKKHLAANLDQVETVEQINLMDFSKGASKAANLPSPKASKAANSVMDGFAQMFTDQENLINFIRKIHADSGAMLAKFEAEEG